MKNEHNIRALVCSYVEQLVWPDLLVNVIYFGRVFQRGRKELQARTECGTKDN